ncbi:metallopeptidase domain-containing protein [Undibacterium parvum]|uniref:Uncharacterized protein n=1 Tax=Undibacterium parvum TaxID=401471 RepID=A0A3S5HM65_9BURK|nr:hypothetical protein [Undibacterium parvum]AZP14116.1 hypothetical protein EJN92_20195 [Undibacterium parvum]
MFKTLRIAFLLFVLAAVGMAAWRAKTNSVAWKYTLIVNVYPINADASPVSEAYVRALTVDEFRPLEKFMLAEAARRERAANASIELRLGPTLTSVPPAPPVAGSVLDVIIWSLQLRWWSFRNAETHGPGAQIKLFVLYFDPNKSSQLDHSTALQKALLGRVNVFATSQMKSQNNVIIAHEFLHTLGATDKYDLQTNQPIFPQGYAHPEQDPLYPQQFAEIMGGRTALTRSSSSIPLSLDHVVIGDQTAREINWVN